MAFESLYREHYGLVLTVLDARVSDIHEAQDLAVGVFELALIRMRDGQEVGLPWLYQCARNLVGNEYQRRERRRRLHLRLVGEAIVQPPVVPEPSDGALAAALGTLAEAEREIIAMTYWYDMSAREIASVIGSTEGAVRVRLSRVRRQLRERLESAEARLEALDG